MCAGYIRYLRKADIGSVAESAASRLMGHIVSLMCLFDLPKKQINRRHHESVRGE
jgi:hypothetical protein